MPTPRVSIDNLPSKFPPETDDSLIIQDSGVTKRTTIASLLTIPSSGLTAHLTDTVDAHDATAISTTDSGTGINGATVQAQLGQLATKTDTNTSAVSTRVLKTGDTMTGPLVLPGPPVADLQAATKLYVDSTFSGGGSGYVAKTGDTMTGLLVLSGDPTATLGAATKKYVDSHRGIAGANQSGTATSAIGGTIIDILSMSVNVTGPGLLLCFGTSIVTAKTVATDRFALHLNLSGSAIATSQGSEDQSAATLNAHGYYVVPSGTLGRTLTLQGQRVSGTGTATYGGSVLTKLLSWIFIPS